MAALCRTRAAAAEGRFLRPLLVARPDRGAGTDSGSGRESPEPAEPAARPGGFASALERHSALQRQAGRGRPEVRRGGRAGGVGGGAGSLGGAAGREGGARGGLLSALGAAPRGAACWAAGSTERGSRRGAGVRRPGFSLEAPGQ